MAVLSSNQRRKGVKFSDMGEYGFFSYLTKNGNKGFEVNISDVENPNVEVQTFNLHGEPVAQIGGNWIRLFNNGKKQSNMTMTIPEDVATDIKETVQHYEGGW